MQQSPMSTSDYDRFGRTQSPKKAGVYFGATDLAAKYPSNDVEHLCVDELCNCSQHKCPGHHQRVPFEGNTMYKCEYDRKPLPEKPPPCPKTPYERGAPFDADTTHRTDYLRWPLPEHQKYQVTPSQRVPFDGSTRYRDDYIAKTADPNHNYAPRYHPNLAKFDGTTTNRVDFDEKPLEKPPPRMARSYSHSVLPFDSTTTNRDDFKRWPLGPPQARLEPEARPHIPFEGTTSYRTEHDEKPLPHYNPYRRDYTPNPARFDSTTTHRTDFDPKPLEARPRPREPASPGTPLPFDGNSNYRTDYVKWPLDATPPAHPQGHQRFPDERDFGTNYRDNHRGLQNQRCPVYDLPKCPSPPGSQREHVFWDTGRHMWC